MPETRMDYNNPRFVVAYHEVSKSSDMTEVTEKQQQQHNKSYLDKCNKMEENKQSGVLFSSVQLLSHLTY